jgi:hypothetical protein
LAAVTKAAANAGLKIKDVEVANSSVLSSPLRADLYQGSALGSHTQALARFAVASNVTESNQLLVSGDGTKTMSAIDFINWLRTPPPGMPAGPRSASWSGPVHAFWEHSGSLRDSFKSQKQSWMSGSVLAYGGRKSGSDHNTLTAMLDLCNYLGNVKDEPACLGP